MTWFTTSSERGHILSKHACTVTFIMDFWSWSFCCSQSARIVNWLQQSQASYLSASSNKTLAEVAVCAAFYLVTTFHGKCKPTVAKHHSRSLLKMVERLLLCDCPGQIYCILPCFCDKVTKILPSLPSCLVVWSKSHRCEPRQGSCYQRKVKCSSRSTCTVWGV